MEARAGIRRLRLVVTGAVQGVGFRPHVYRRAQALELGGSVCNTPAGALIEVEGASAAVERFRGDLAAGLPPPARIDAVAAELLPVQGQSRFRIVASVTDGNPTAPLLPDLATCPDCLREVLDPCNRRYGYPFTTCMHCGPRYSVTEALPFDRGRTAMRHFPLCDECRREYDDPLDRRFHAQTIACPACGPRLRLLDGAGREAASPEGAIAAAADIVRAGGVLALKGLGGFQLLVDARNDAAVRELRARKRRPAKPFGLMVAGVEQARLLARVDAAEQQALSAPSAPIVLLRADPAGEVVADAVAPGLPWLGIMLAYTPLHHLLLRQLCFPVVATSGNRAGNPLVSDEGALHQLEGVADAFLVHDRPILNPVDDSVVRVIAGGPRTIRCARGLAPVTLACNGTGTVLALGGHLKNGVAWAGQGRLVLGPHVGDLESLEMRGAWAARLASLPRLLGGRSSSVARDRHPGYYSSERAEAMGLPVTAVPHHLAHVLAGAADNGLEGPFLGVAWDGSGYGDDATLWGGEFLQVSDTRYRRGAHWLAFALPGGEQAVREPRRAALGVLHAAFGDAAFAMTDLEPLRAFAPGALPVIARMLQRGFNAPACSSVGRLFDAVASLLGLCQQSGFEGQAAMTVEAAAQDAAPRALPPAEAVAVDGAWVLDWRPPVRALVAGWREGVPPGSLAAGFHEMLVASIVAAALRLGERRVVLSGGCFQNRLLTEAAMARLRAAGFEPFIHRRVPTNDGGLAVGQALYAMRPRRGEMA